MGVAAAGSEVEKNLIVRGGACEPPAKREMGEIEKLSNG